MRTDGLSKEQAIDILEKLRQEYIESNDEEKEDWGVVNHGHRDRILQRSHENMVKTKGDLDKVLTCLKFHSLTSS